MPERRRKISGNTYGNSSLPYYPDGSGSARTDSSSNASWQHGSGQEQLPKRDPLDHLNYFDLGSSTPTTSRSQFSIKQDDDQIGIPAPPSSLISSDAFSFDLALPLYTKSNDGFMSHSSPESATWQPGEVFTPTSSYMGSQPDDNPLSDGQSGSFGSLNSFTSSSPDTIESGFSENFGVLDTSPTWGSPSSNERLLDDLSMPGMFINSFIALLWRNGIFGNQEQPPLYDCWKLIAATLVSIMDGATNLRVNLTGGYFDIVPRSSHSFARDVRDTSKEAPSEGGYMAGPSGWNTFNCYTIADNANWTTIDPVDAQFSSVQDPAESLHQAHIPWNPEHPQHGKYGVNAGNGAFVPEPGYPLDMFKYREDFFRASNPVRPYFGPEGSFLVRENDHGQKQQPSGHDIVPCAYDSESPQELLEAHEHVFSVVTGMGTPDNHRGRKRKLTPEERERTLEVRKYGACWACHLSKTKVCPILMISARSRLMAP